MCPVIHLMTRNKFECTAKAKGCLYVLCWVWGSSVSSLTREAVPAEQFPYCFWCYCQNTVENSAPRVLHYHVFAPRRMNSLRLFIVLSFYLHNVTQISGRWSWAAWPPAELAESHLCSVSTQTLGSPAGTKPSTHLDTCCAGTVLSVDPKFWKDSWWWHFTTWDFFFQCVVEFFS